MGSRNQREPTRANTHTKHTHTHTHSTLLLMKKIVVVTLHPFCHLSVQHGGCSEIRECECGCERREGRGICCLVLHTRFGRHTRAGTHTTQHEFHPPTHPHQTQHSDSGFKLKSACMNNLQSKYSVQSEADRVGGVVQSVGHTQRQTPRCCV